MSDTYTLTASKCEHGNWASHNAFRLPDGQVVDDPDGLCPGGVFTTDDGRRFHISHAFALTLKWLEEEET